MKYFDLDKQEKQLLNDANVFKVEYDDFNYLPNSLRNVSAFPYIVSYSFIFFKPFNFALKFSFFKSSSIFFLAAFIFNPT